MERDSSQEQKIGSLTHFRDQEAKDREDGFAGPGFQAPDTPMTLSPEAALCLQSATLQDKHLTLPFTQPGGYVTIKVGEKFLGNLSYPSLIVCPPSIPVPALSLKVWGRSQKCHTVIMTDVRSPLDYI